MKKTAIILAFVALFASCAESLPFYDSSTPPVLVQGAMKIETEMLISALDEPVKYDVRHWSYAAGKIDGYPVVVNVTHSGYSNAAASTALAIEIFKPCAVINQGTAGAHDPGLSRGDVVIVADCFNASAWQSLPSKKGEGVDYRKINLLGRDVYETDSGRGGLVFLPSDEKLTASAFAVKDKYTLGRVISGRAASFDSWERRVDRILFLHEKFGSSCEEMETFPAADICRIYGVPFLGVRIISNSAIKNESYKPELGIECQKFVIEIVKNYIEALKK